MRNVAPEYKVQELCLVIPPYQVLTSGADIRHLTLRLDIQVAPLHKFAAARALRMNSPRCIFGFNLAATSLDPMTSQGEAGLPANADLAQVKSPNNLSLDLRG